MRNETTIDGVRLTRGQVERALEELNKQAFRAGDLVSVCGTRMFVVGGMIGARAAALYGTLPSGYVRVTDGLDTTTVAEKELVLIP